MLCFDTVTCLLLLFYRAVYSMFPLCEHETMLYYCIMKSYCFVFCMLNCYLLPAFIYAQYTCLAFRLTEPFHPGSLAQVLELDLGEDLVRPFSYEVQMAST